MEICAIEMGSAGEGDVDAGRDMDGDMGVGGDGGGDHGGDGEEECSEKHGRRLSWR